MIVYEVTAWVEHQQQQGTAALHQHGAQLGAGLNGSAPAFNFGDAQQHCHIQLAQQDPPLAFPSSQPTLEFPALYLYPINDSFIPKHIALSNNQHVKIGRQTNTKTAPGDKNGYFDSKVLSRQHAEVWEEGGKVHIPTVLAAGLFLTHKRRFTLRMSKAQTGPSSTASG